MAVDTESWMQRFPKPLQNSPQPFDSCSSTQASTDCTGSTEESMGECIGSGTCQSITKGCLDADGGSSLAVGLEELMGRISRASYNISVVKHPL